MTMNAGQVIGKEGRLFHEAEQTHTCSTASVRVCH